jgi:YHS domain-containing protein
LFRNADNGLLMGYEMKRIFLVIVNLIVLVGCAAMNAQNPGAGYGPVNAQPIAEGRVMLGGYDVTTYFTDMKPVRGEARFASVYKDVTFHFASAANKQRFEAAPEQFLPQFGGYCANGIVYGIPWGGNGDSWAMRDGKLYIFGGASSKDAFMLDAKNNLALAEKYWKDEVNGSNSIWQRTRRLLFRVPHYKSGEQLAKEVADAKAAGRLPKD